MKQTLLAERIHDESRLAVIEDGQLCELLLENPENANIAGNIYLGRVENVIPGLNAAFVDIGLDKKWFLAANDVIQELPGPLDAQKEKTTRIEKMLRPGQTILVQVLKAQGGTKGPRLTCRITLAGRWMALMPAQCGVGVSKKIADDACRERIKKIGESLACDGDVGLIMRTAAAGADAEALQAEYDQLVSRWKHLEDRARYDLPPKCLHDDNALTVHVVRDCLRGDVDALWVEGEALFQELLQNVYLYAPDFAGRILLHTGQIPLFDLYRVDSQIARGLQKYVWLKNGGSLVIEETEALTVVDVNTAKNTGRESFEDTVLQNNLEAARELMRQLRLRDIGGIIVVDFIDMKREEHRKALLEELCTLAVRDSNRVTVVGITALGLVELTRKRIRKSLNRQLTHTCAACKGSGAVLSHETMARMAVREIWRRRRNGEGEPLLVETSAPVCGWLRRIGVPQGGDVYALEGESLPETGWRVSPADPSALSRAVKLC